MVLNLKNTNTLDTVRKRVFSDASTKQAFPGVQERPCGSMTGYFANVTYHCGYVSPIIFNTLENEENRLHLKIQVIWFP